MNERKAFERNMYEDLLLMLGAHSAVSVIKKWAEMGYEPSQHEMEDMALVTKYHIADR
jgi:hypothetical protein